MRPFDAEHELRTIQLRIAAIFLSLSLTGVCAADDGSNSRKMKATIRINGDGSVSGNADVTLKGRHAVDVRGFIGLFRQSPANHLVGFMLLNAGYDGTGKFESDDVSMWTDTFRYKASFEFKDFTRMPGKGAFAIRWVFYERDYVERLGAIVSAGSAGNLVCFLGSSREEYVFILPKTLKIVSIPENLSHQAGNLSYEATYRLMGNQLTATRQIEDRNRGKECSPTVAADYQSFYAKVIPNLKAQVVYR